MDRILSAAGAALGVTLTEAHELSRGRSLVLRARAGDRSVVLKAPLQTGSGPARELAALRVLRGVPDAVPLLAEADDPPVLVLADLGDGPSLADALLGTDPTVAEAALGDWAATLGRLQAATTDRGEAFAAGPVRRAFLHHRLRAAPGTGPLLDLAAETAIALSREHGVDPLPLMPAFR